MSQTLTKHILEVDWSLADAEAVHPANVFLAQAHPDYHVLTIGFVCPPIVVEKSGPPTSAKAQPITRLILTPRDFRELIKILSENEQARSQISAASQEVES